MPIHLHSYRKMVATQGKRERGVAFLRQGGLVAALCLCICCLATLTTHAQEEENDADASPVALDRVAKSWGTGDGLPQNSVNTALQTRDGYLWVGTNAGLARFDGVQFRKFGLSDGLPSVLITALAEDWDGGLWVGTSGGGVSRWISGRFTSIGGAEGLSPSVEVIALAASKDGSVWIGTEKGLVQWSEGRLKVMGEAEGLPRKQVRALLCDSQDRLWVSVIQDGVYTLRDGRFERVAGGVGAPKSAYAFAEDSDGAILAATDKLMKWSQGKWAPFDAVKGLPRGEIGSITVGKNGAYWVGTRSHGLFSSVNGQFVRAAGDGALSTNSVRVVLEDRDGSVWAGVVSGGLHRLSPRVLQYWSRSAGLEPTTVTSVAEDSDGVLWAGTANRGVNLFENGRFTRLKDAGVPAHILTFYTVTRTDDGAT